MKTTYSSEYSKRYDVLFQDALAALEQAWEDGSAEALGLAPLTDDEGNTTTFQNLEDYFTRIGDLAKLHSAWVTSPLAKTEDYDKYSKFLMLPMEEVFGDGLFVIDANARTIKIPNNFVKNGVSLSGDELAETLLFEIDRFFDVTDLVTTDIYVQWFNPAGKEGVSKITMVDYNTKPGKIIFGWPITSKITSSEGKLQFAVRFFKKDGELITYSMNTSPVTVNIKASLGVDWTKAEVDDPAQALAAVIENGPISGAPDAAKAQFEYPLASWADLDENGELKLAVSMLTFDSGTLTYKLSYLPKYIVNNVTTDMGIDTTPTVTVEPVKTNDKVAVANKRYYKSDGKGGYEMVAFNVGDTLDDSIIEMNGTYWVRWNAEVTPHVTGAYQFNVQNNANKKNPAISDSNYLVIPTVDSTTVKFDIDLPSDHILAEANVGESLTVAASGKVAQVDVVPVEKQACNIAYQWKKRSSEKGEFVDDGTDATYASATPGWYQVTAVVSRNKEECVINSNICRVVNAPVAPVLNHPETEDLPVYQEDVNTLSVEITNMEDYPSKLESDGFEYKWFRNVADQPGIPVASGDVDVVSMSDGTLIVELKDDEYEGFYCEVTNILAGKKATSKSALFTVVNP